MLHLETSPSEQSVNDFIHNSLRSAHRRSSRYSPNSYTKSKAHYQIFSEESLMYALDIIERSWKDQDCLHSIERLPSDWKRPAWTVFKVLRFSYVWRLRTEDTILNVLGVYRMSVAEIQLLRPASIVASLDRSAKWEVWSIEAGGANVFAETCVSLNSSPKAFWHVAVVF